MSRERVSRGQPGPGGSRPGDEDEGVGTTTQTAALPTMTGEGSSPVAGTLSRESEADAVERSRGGDREAFDSLVLRHQRNVYRLCYRYVNDHADANDLTQEVFLRAWRAVGRFRGQSRFSTWLYRIAVNACLNFRAARKTPTLELSDQLPDPRAAASERLVREERARRVREAVARLPEKQRATLILKVYNDLTHREVARVLGSSVGTVKANLFHALGNLRKLVAEGKE